MRYKLREIPEMLRTPVGRVLLYEGLNYRLWPLTSRLAWLYRSTVVRRTRVIAVVGSFGKSTTLRAVCAAVGVPTDWRRFNNAWSAVARALLEIRPGMRHAVVEVGIAAPGQMEGYARTVRPDVAVVTSIGSEHQRSFGSLESTRAEKAWMVRALSESGTAILNGDDPHVMWMRGETPARVVTFGFGERCDMRALEFRPDGLRGTRLRVRAFGEEREVAIRLLGRHMVYPALAAIAVAQVEGFPLDETLSRLGDLRPRRGGCNRSPCPTARGCCATISRRRWRQSMRRSTCSLRLRAVASWCWGASPKSGIRSGPSTRLWASGSQESHPYS